jgi:hypothetical protein
MVLCGVVETLFWIELVDVRFPVNRGRPIRVRSLCPRCQVGEKFDRSWIGIAEVYVEGYERVEGNSLAVWSGGFGAVGWTSGGSDFANLCTLRRTLKVNQDLGEWIPSTTSSACWKHTPRCMTLTTAKGCKKSFNRIRCCSSIRQR